NVEDAALLTAAMAGLDARDASTFSAPRVDFAAALAGEPDIRGMRLTALAAAHFPPTTEPAVLRAFNDAIAGFRELGAMVEEARAPFDLEDMMVRNGRIIAAEAWAMHRAYIEDPALYIDPCVRKRTLGGKSVSAADYFYVLAQRQRHEATIAQLL